MESFTITFEIEISIMATISIKAMIQRNTDANEISDTIMIKKQIKSNVPDKNMTIHLGGLYIFSFDLIFICLPLNHC